MFVLDLHRRGIPADLAEETWERLRRQNKHGRLPADLPKLTLASEATRRELVDRFNAEMRDLRAAGLADLPEIDAGTIAPADGPARDHLTDGDWDAVAGASAPAAPPVARDGLLRRLKQYGTGPGAEAERDVSLSRPRRPDRAASRAQSTK